MPVVSWTSSTQHKSIKSKRDVLVLAKRHVVAGLLDCIDQYRSINLLSRGSSYRNDLHGHIDHHNTISWLPTSALALHHILPTAETTLSDRSLLPLLLSWIKPISVHFYFILFILLFICQVDLVIWPASNILNRTLMRLSKSKWEKTQDFKSTLYINRNITNVCNRSFLVC